MKGLPSRLRHDPGWASALTAIVSPSDHTRSRRAAGISPLEETRECDKGHSHLNLYLLLVVRR